MTDFEFSDYYYETDTYSAGGVVQFEFIDSPALSGEDVEFTFRNAGSASAPAGAVVANVAVLSHDNLILGGGKTTIRDELRPGDAAGSRIRPIQYTPNDGHYSLTITVGGDARHVAYQVHDHHVHAP